MKLCPQCEFIYEDDQNFCDMDGETLVFDTRLGVFPGNVPAVTGPRPRKSRLRIIALPVAAGLVLSALLCISYYASSAALNSNFASRNLQPESSRNKFSRADRATTRQLLIPISHWSIPIANAP